MPRSAMKTDTFTSDISKKEFPTSERVSASSLRKTLMDHIKAQHPAFSSESHLALSEVNRFRETYIAEFLVREMGELTTLEETVLRSMRDQTLLSEKPENEEAVSLTLGQRLADRVAAFGGSWNFIILFTVLITLWIGSNVLLLANRGFDPYPFILLNLILSCIAAFQAPVIMMSQNRQEEKDRERARKDYMINLKSELEIRTLHEKMDHLIMHQQQELLEIQRVQIEMMNDILHQVGQRKSNG